MMLNHTMYMLWLVLKQNEISFDNNIRDSPKYGEMFEVMCCVSYPGSLLGVSMEE